MIEQAQILVLDPDVQTAADCNKVFSDRGWQIDCADTFADAERLLQQRSYDVAIIELMLPDIDGIEAWAHIRSISPNMAGIITTSSVSLLSSVYALERGVLAYLQKPLKMPVLSNFIDQYLEHRRVVKERGIVGRELVGLSTLLSSITQASDSEQVIRKTLAHLQAVFKFDWAVLCLQGEDKLSWKHLVHHHMLNDPGELTDAQFQFVQERIVEVVHSLQPKVWIQSSVSNLDAQSSALKQLGMRDLALVPVIGYGELYGVLAIINSSMTLANPTPCDIDLLNIVGQAMALALDRTQLRQRLDDAVTQDRGAWKGARSYLDSLIALESARWKRYARPFSIVLIDTVNMQPHYPNDEYRGGPRAVGQVATVAQSLVRRSDVVAHVSDWQVAILLPETTPPGAEQVVGRLAQAIEAQVIASNTRELPGFRILTPSEDAENLEDLIQVQQPSFAQLPNNASL